MIIHTQRLCLRPWSDADAPALFELARDPRIGMLCGWKPYELIDDAHEALSTFLAAPDSYAVTFASTGEIVGSIALRIDTDSPEATVADIGYWIGAPYWGNGYATEAGNAIIERARELGVSRQTISSLEKGRYNPSILLAFKIARRFDLSIEDVFIYREEDQ